MAYIHRFKREAKRCNFTNNAATIRVFVKGLRNAHTLAACVYEKGPQTLADTINAVEKLQAAQQLTATLLPSSTINVITNEGDQYFQCQELVHIARNCPNMHCFECNEYGHIAADYPDRIPPSAIPAHHRNGTQGIVSDQSLGTNTRTGTGIAGQDCNHTLIDIEVTVMILHVEVIPDHTTVTPIEALPNTITPAPIVTTVTHHTGNLHHIGAYQPTPEIAVGPEHAYHINPVRTPHLNPYPDLVGQQ